MGIMEKKMETNIYIYIHNSVIHLDARGWGLGFGAGVLFNGTCRSARPEPDVALPGFARGSGFRTAGLGGYLEVQHARGSPKP